MCATDLNNKIITLETIEFILFCMIKEKLCIHSLCNLGILPEQTFETRSDMSSWTCRFSWACRIKPYITGFETNKY